MADLCNSMALSTTLALSQSLHLPTAVEHRAQVLCCKNGGLGLQVKTLALPQVKLNVCNSGQLTGHARPGAVKKRVHVPGRRGYVVTCAVDDNGSSSSDGAESSDDEVVTPGAGGAAGTVDSNVSLTSSARGSAISLFSWFCTTSKHTSPSNTKSSFGKCATHDCRAKDFRIHVVWNAI